MIGTRSVCEGLWLLQGERGRGGYIEDTRNTVQETAEIAWVEHPAEAWVVVDLNSFFLALQAQPCIVPNRPESLVQTSGLA